MSTSRCRYAAVFDLLMRHSYPKLLGMSLLELSVALALGSGLTLILLKMYQVTVVNSVQQVQQLQQHSDVLRIATLLQHEVNAAGFIGCPHWDSSLPVTPLQSQELINATDALKIYQATAQHWQPALPITLQGKVMAGTDVLQILHGQGALHHVLATTQAAKVSITMPTPLTQGDQVVIADCSRAVIAEIGGVFADHIQLTRALPEPFSPPATVVLLQRHYFFVNRQGALAWKMFDHGAQSLMEKVTQWRIRPLTPTTPMAAKSMIGVEITLGRADVTQPWQIQLGWFNHP